MPPAPAIHSPGETGRSSEYPKIAGAEWATPSANSGCRLCFRQSEPMQHFPGLGSRGSQGPLRSMERRLVDTRRRECPPLLELLGREFARWHQRQKRPDQDSLWPISSQARTSPQRYRTRRPMRVKRGSCRRCRRLSSARRVNPVRRATSLVVRRSSSGHTLSVAVSGWSFDRSAGTCFRLLQPRHQCGGGASQRLIRLATSVVLISYKPIIIFRSSFRLYDTLPSAEFFK